MSWRKCRRKNGESTQKYLSICLSVCLCVCVCGGGGGGGHSRKEKVQHALIPIVNISINLYNFFV